MLHIKNVDLIATMTEIFNATVFNFKEDFDYDLVTLEQLRKAQKPQLEELNYLWITRRNGTHFVPEAALFHRDSYAQSVYTHNENTGNLFLVDVTCNKSLTGNLTLLKKGQRHGDFHLNDFCMSYCDVLFDSGVKESLTIKDYKNQKYDLIEKFGEVVDITYKAEPEEELYIELHVTALRKLRERLPSCSLDKIMAALKKS